LVHKPGQSLTEFLDIDLIKGLFRLDVFQSMKTHVARFFKDPRLRELMEFPVLFLGALPEKTPALYSLMNYADMEGGTWFPAKGMYQIVQGMYDLALELGVEFNFGQEVTAIDVHQGVATAVYVGGKPGESSTTRYTADVIIGGADYHHIETDLLPEAYRSYSPDYWEKRVMAPGCLLYYVGLNKKLGNVPHHSLFFDTSFEVHGKEIYTSKEWPSEPLFYLNVTSVTDSSTAPPGGENLFILIPVAAGLTDDTPELREHYFQMVMERLEKRFGQSIRDAIVVKQSVAPRDFVSDYHSFKGNAYGLANTLMQTAVLKPSLKSKKVKNLFFTGQLTVPGPGVPPSLISGEVVAKEVNKLYS
jgi:phytoene desaturase